MKKEWRWCAESEKTQWYFNREEYIWYVVCGMKWKGKSLGETENSPGTVPNSVEILRGKFAMVKIYELELLFL